MPDGKGRPIIEVRCACGEVHRFHERYAGRTAKCPKVGKRFIIPKPLAAGGLPAEGVDGIDRHPSPVRGETRIRRTTKQRNRLHRRLWTLIAIGCFGALLVITAVVGMQAWSATNEDQASANRAARRQAIASDHAAWSRVEEATQIVTASLTTAGIGVRPPDKSIPQLSTRGRSTYGVTGLKNTAVPRTGQYGMDGAIKVVHAAQEYLAAFPHGMYAAKANQAIQEATAWRRLLQNDQRCAIDVREYLIRHPESLFSLAANAELSRLQRIEDAERILGDIRRRTHDRSRWEVMEALANFSVQYDGTSGSQKALRSIEDQLDNVQDVDAAQRLACRLGYLVQGLDPSAARHQLAVFVEDLLVLISREEIKRLLPQAGTLWYATPFDTDDTTWHSIETKLSIVGLHARTVHRIPTVHIVADKEDAWLWYQPKAELEPFVPIGFAKDDLITILDVSVKKRELQGGLSRRSNGSIVLRGITRVYDERDELDSVDVFADSDHVLTLNPSSGTAVFRFSRTPRRGHPALSIDPGQLGNEGCRVVRLNEHKDLQVQTGTVVEYNDEQPRVLLRSLRASDIEAWTPMYGTNAEWWRETRLADVCDEHE